MPLTVQVKVDGESKTTDIRKKKTDKGSAYRENLASVVIVCLLRVLTNEYQ